MGGLKTQSRLRGFVIHTISCSAKSLAFNNGSDHAGNRRSLGSLFPALGIVGDGL